MTDKELLEMAAKACGWQVIWYGTKSEIAPINTHGGASGTRWNPLTDDGDALRLAITIGVMRGRCMQIVIDSAIEWTGVRHTDRGGKYDALEKHDHNPYAATRRAIVLAAAEIGKEIK